MAGDVAEGLVAQRPSPAVYFPLQAADYARPAAQGMTLMVRAVPGVDVVAAVRREIPRWMQTSLRSTFAACRNRSTSSWGRFA